jgi:tight adherence protein C
MELASLLLIVGVTGIFLALLLSLSAIGVFSNEARGVSRSLAVLDAFTSAPDALKQEFEPSFNDRVVAPLLNRFVGMGKKLTPSDHEERVRHRLEVAGNPPGWTIDRVTSLKFVGFAVLLVVSLIGSLSLGLGIAPAVVACVLASMVGYLSPNMYLYQKGHDRTEKMQKALPDSLDLLTISVEAGLGFDSALSHVARNTDGPLSEEFARVLQEMQIGLGRSKALRALGERTTLLGLRGFVSSMVQADAFGIPIGEVLRVQSTEIRLKRRQRAEEAAQKVPVKILFPLMFCILPTLFIAVMGPGVIGIMTSFGGGRL